jgi:hypothetical protein
LADDLKVAKITISNSPLNYSEDILPELYFSSENVVVKVSGRLGAVGGGLAGGRGFGIGGFEPLEIGSLSTRGILLKLATQSFADDAETGVVSNFNELGGLLGYFYSRQGDPSIYPLFLDLIKKSVGAAKGISTFNFGDDYESRWGDDVPELESESLFIHEIPAACGSCFRYSVEFSNDLYGRAYLKSTDGLVRGVFYDALISHYNTVSGLSIRTDTSGNPPVGGTIFGGVIGADQGQSSSYSGLRYSAVGSIFGSAVAANVSVQAANDVVDDFSVTHRADNRFYTAVYLAESGYVSGNWLSSRPTFNLGLGGVLGAASLLPLDAAALQAASCDSIDCQSR